MSAILLTLALASPDPAPASADLERLQGVWIGDNGTTLRIDGDSIELSTGDDSASFCRLVLMSRAGRLALVDDAGRLELPYRVEGRRLLLGKVEYVRKNVLSDGP